MTISTTTNQVNYTGDGVSTSFAFNGPFVVPADLKVYINGAIQAAGYTVVGVAPNGGSGTFTSGTVTFTTAPASLAQILIYSDPDLLQSTSLPANDPFQAKTVEKALDKLTLLVQRVKSALGLSITAPVGESGTNLTLPDKVTRAGKLAGFDGSGNLVMIVAAAQSATALALGMLGNAGATLMNFLAAGTAAGLQNIQTKLRQIPSVEDSSVIGSSFSAGIVVPGDDTATLPAAIASMITAGYRKATLSNPAGYKTTATIVQPYNFSLDGCRQQIYCESIPHTTETPAYRVAYASWTDNVDRFHFRKPLSDVLMRGHATPADGVWTANLDGIQFEAYHQVVEGITLVGFDKAFAWAPSTGAYTGWLSWETKLNNCVAYANHYGLYADFSTAGGLSGAGITMRGGALAHNNYSLYNNCGELTLDDVASDAPVVAHILDNITMLGGNEIGFLHINNSRFEAGGQAGVPWITNSGILRISDSAFVERNSADLIFYTNATGYTRVSRGWWRTSDGRYKAGGPGSILQDGIRPINDSNGVFFNSANSGIRNNDFADVTGSGLNGWTNSVGTITATNVADATKLFAGRKMNILVTAFVGGKATMVSDKGVFKRQYQDFTLCFKGDNANATNPSVFIRQFNAAGVEIASAVLSVGIPSGAASLPLAIKGTRAVGADTFTVEVTAVTGQTLAIGVSDFYLTEW